MLDSKLLASVAALCLFSFTARADDWPQFRGPNRDGISRETGWLTQWPTSGLKVLWKQSVGRGYSSVAIANGRVFTIGLLPRDESKKKAHPTNAYFV